MCKYNVYTSFILKVKLFSKIRNKIFKKLFNDDIKKHAYLLTKTYITK